jgi:hypothetical protein
LLIAPAIEAAWSVTVLANLVRSAADTIDQRGCSSGLVLDDDSCAKSGLELISDQAAEKVDRATRWITYNQFMARLG